MSDADAPPRKFATKLEVMWRDTSESSCPGPDSPFWRIGIIANGQPKAPFFCDERNCWLYPVILTDRPTGPRILLWVREDEICGSIIPQPRATTRSVLGVVSEDPKR